MKILWWSMLLVACGGSLQGPGGNDGGSDSSPSQDAGGGPCPASPPANNGGCSDNGLRCEYGSSPSPQCNQLFICMNGGWVDESSGVTCPPPSDCPSTYASVPQGSVCNESGLACAYPQGTCFCTNGPGPVSQNVMWDCIPATAQCPSPRPDIGSVCSSPGQTCQYGGCLGGVNLQCNGGTWQQVETPCPL